MGVPGTALVRDWRCQTLSTIVETRGTEQGSPTADDTTIVSKIEFDFRHGAIVVSLALQEKRSSRRQLRNVMSDVSQSSSSWIVTRSIPLETVD